MKSGLFQIGQDGSSPIMLSSLAKLKYQEKDLENWIYKKPEILFPSGEVIWVSRQFIDEMGSRSDLVGVDKAGNLIIAEFKRGTVTTNAVTQLLRYGAEYTRLNDGGIDIFLSTIPSESRQVLTETVLQHIEEGRLSGSHRLILIGESFEPEAISIIRYLSSGTGERPYEFECYEINMYVNENQKLMSVTKIYPEATLEITIEERREESRALRYQNDPIRTGWITEFMRLAKTSDFAFKRKNGQKYGCFKTTVSGFEVYVDYARGEWPYISFAKGSEIVDADGVILESETDVDDEGYVYCTIDFGESDNPIYDENQAKMLLKVLQDTCEKAESKIEAESLQGSEIDANHE